MLGSVVLTQVVSASLTIPIDYKMIHQNGWKIYDVNIEGVSFIRNYRTQFHNVLRKEGFNNLIERLKKKTENLQDLIF